MPDPNITVPGRALRRRDVLGIAAAMTAAGAALVGGSSAAQAGFANKLSISSKAPTGRPYPVGVNAGTARRVGNHGPVR